METVGSTRTPITAAPILRTFVDMNLLNGLLLVAALAFSIYRQMRPRPVRGLTMAMPLILMGYGVYTAFLGPHPTGLVDGEHLAASLLLLVVGLLFEAGLGVLRGMTVHTWRAADGTVWRRGTVATLGLWAALILVRVGIVVAGGFLLHTEEPAAAILVGVGITLLAQNLVTTMRASRLEPIAPVTVAR